MTEHIRLCCDCKYYKKDWSSHIIGSGDHKMYEMLYEGTEEECRQYAYDNYTDKEYYQMCLMDWEAREWEV
jgi:hypothetical protein